MMSRPALRSGRRGKSLIFGEELECHARHEQQRQAPLSRAVLSFACSVS
jgi:hypothetical protein